MGLGAGCRVGCLVGTNLPLTPVRRKALSLSIHAAANYLAPSWQDLVGDRDEQPQMPSSTVYSGKAVQTVTVADVQRVRDTLFQPRTFLTMGVMQCAWICIPAKRRTHPSLDGSTAALQQRCCHVRVQPHTMQLCRTARTRKAARTQVKPHYF